MPLLGGHRDQRGPSCFVRRAGIRFLHAATYDDSDHRSRMRVPRQRPPTGEPDVADEVIANRAAVELVGSGRDVDGGHTGFDANRAVALMQVGDR
jgi:hypothetical protein